MEKIPTITIGLPTDTNCDHLETSAGSSFSPSSYRTRKPQQDFHKSLLPLREPLNPSPAADLSDKHITFGILPLLSDDLEDADDSMSTSDYEEEDGFNVTLRTPLRPMGSLRSQIRPRRLVAAASGSSAVSVPSRSSALTTIDNGSSLRTSTSSDSILSAPGPTNTNSPSIIGKKRSYPRNNKDPHSATTRVRQIEEGADASREDIAEVTATLRPAPVRESTKSSYPRIIGANSDESAATQSTTSNSPVHTDEQDHEPVQPEEKRRKILRSSTSRKTRATYTVNPVRPVRARVTRHASPPLRNSQKTKILGTRASKRPATRAAATRAATGLSTDHVKENDASMGASSSASVSDHSLSPPPVPRKPSKRSTHRNA